MINSKELFKLINHNLPEQVSPGEKQAIALFLLESISGLNATQILTGWEVSESTSDRILEMLPRIQRGEPVQYLVGKAPFCGLWFHVDERVLIPRPETEQLVDLVVNLAPESPIIFDAGTGSGCIAISLASRLKTAIVHAGDLSDGALELAGLNANESGVHVTLYKHDILNDPLPVKADILVSNPPYISRSEPLPTHVYNFEPHMALFAADEDALEFYESLATHTSSLRNNGWLVVETHESRAENVLEIFERHGLKNNQIYPDFTGRSRFVAAQKKDEK